MSIVEAKKKWGLAPAFNVEFVAYYEDREKRIKALRKQVSLDRKESEQLKNQDSEVTLKLDKVNRTLSDSLQVNETLRKKVEMYRALLELGGLDHNAVPKVEMPKVGKPGSNAISSVSIKARCTAYSSHLASQVSFEDHLAIN